MFFLLFEPLFFLFFICYFLFCCPGFYILHIGKKIIENDDYGKKIKKAGFWLVKEKGAVYMWTGSEVVFKKKRKKGKRWSEKKEH